nr:immunoglobulin light chain junction region [Macaca mulatta]
CQQGNSMPWTF